MALPLRYSVGNLLARRTRTALTLGVIALVVLATTLLLVARLEPAAHARHHRLAAAT